jgi:hypothetical protein
VQKNKVFADSIKKFLPFINEFSIQPFTLTLAKCSSFIHISCSNYCVGVTLLRRIAHKNFSHSCQLFMHFSQLKKYKMLQRNLALPQYRICWSLFLSVQFDFLSRSCSFSLSFSFFSFAQATLNSLLSSAFFLIDFSPPLSPLFSKVCECVCEFCGFCSSH